MSVHCFTVIECWNSFLHNYAGEQYEYLLGSRSQERFRSLSTYTEKQIARYEQLEALEEQTKTSWISTIQPSKPASKRGRRRTGSNDSGENDAYKVHDPELDVYVAQELAVTTAKVNIWTEMYMCMYIVITCCIIFPGQCWVVQHDLCHPASHYHSSRQHGAQGQHHLTTSSQ